ncbi:MAG: DUF503 domain-containing protein [Clostridiales bacterium]|nr:DUF503 domain-containing protein [Clostridiales bacterium]
MIVGICKLDIYIVDAMTLKDKRMVLRSIKDRLKSKFNISIAETDKNDNWRLAELGISSVSNSGAHIDKMLSNVINSIEADGRIQIIDYYTEKLSI